MDGSGVQESKEVTVSTKRETRIYPREAGCSQPAMWHLQERM